MDKKESKCNIITHGGKKCNNIAKEKLKNINLCGVHKNAVVNIKSSPSKSKSR